MILNHKLKEHIITIEYYRVDIKGFFKRPELEMVKYNGEIIGCRNINNERSPSER